MQRGIVAGLAALAFALAGCSSGSGDEPSTTAPKKSGEPSATAPKKSGEPSSSPTKASKDDKEKVYIKEVRANIPGAAAYDDGALANMATNVCQLGSVDLGVQVLDNYSQIEAEDRRELATIALNTAC